MKKANASLDYTLITICPYCCHSFNLSEPNYDSLYMDVEKAVFNNKWENIGIGIACPKCDQRFILENIEF